MMPFLHSNDATWYKKTTATWCLVEINVGIICACPPTMQPLLTRSFPQAFGTTGARDTADTGSYAMKASRSSAMQRAFNKVQNNGWTTMDGTQKSAVRDESDSGSIRAVVKNDGREEPTSVKTTDYSVTNEPRH